MSDIVNRFKNVFISPKNSNYLFNIIINKLSQRNIHVTENLELYKQNFLELQEMIFNDHFINIYNEIFNKDKSVNLEDVLIKLNQLAVSKFEFIVSQNYIQKNYLQQIQEKNFQQLENNNVIKNNNEVNNVIKNNNNVIKGNNEANENNVVNNNINLQNGNDKLIKKNNDKKHKSNKRYVNKYTMIENDRLENDKLVHNKLGNENNSKVNFITFFSDDANFIDNKYNYDINISNLKSINLESINLLYDMYNITNYNNKFYLLEGSYKHLINIPIGFYTIDKLLEVITKTINYVSANKNKDYKYLIYKNRIKNKVYISCDWIKSKNIDKENNDKDTKLYEMIKDKSNLDFGIIFISNNTSQINYSLCEILGFNKYEYINNNVYVGENSPIENIYQNIYFKIFINDKEIERYYTTKDTFSYYDKINYNLQEEYGYRICHKPNINIPYDIEEQIDMNKISFQFNNSITYSINIGLNFDIVMGFEYI
jgi:hypothetical protein